MIRASFLVVRIGRYEVELQLGEGSLGRVFLARDPVLYRQVAVKILRDDLAASDATRAELSDWLRQEARAAATLSHPAIVPLYDMGEDERHGLFLVYELVRGATLRERLAEGSLSPGEVAQMARSLGAALGHAHAAGLVHRNLRPENVMLGATGPRLTDFGVCPRAFAPAAYVAPEVGATSVQNARSDQFSFAATMYEALTGKRVIGASLGPGASTPVQARFAPPRKQLPALRGFLPLDSVFARGMARAAEDRFPSCEAFAGALAAALEGPRVTFLATPGPVRSSVARITRRWQNRLALVAVAVIAGLLLIGRVHSPNGVAAGKARAAVRPDVPSAPITPPPAVPVGTETAPAVPSGATAARPIDPPGPPAVDR